jgi:HTH-type transcriptional regulator/antitoxin HigA
VPPDKADYIVETDENLIPAPDMISTPGEILKDEMEARGLVQKDLAAILGWPVKLVSEIISGVKQITPQTALELGAALGTGPELWINLEANYRLVLAKQRASGDVVAKRTRIGSSPKK